MCWCSHWRWSGWPVPRSAPPGIRCCSPACLLAFAAATFAADLTSGLLHWGFDTWFSTTHGAFQRMVSIVREHHVKPDEIFTFRFATDSGMLSWFGGSGAFVLLVLSWAVGDRPVAGGGLCLAAVVYSLDVSLMFEYHKWGHRRRRGPVARVLSAAGCCSRPTTTCATIAATTTATTA